MCNNRQSETCILPRRLINQLHVDNEWWGWLLYHASQPRDPQNENEWEIDSQRQSDRHCRHNLRWAIKKLHQFTLWFRVFLQQPHKYEYNVSEHRAPWEQIFFNYLSIQTYKHELCQSIVCELDQKPPLFCQRLQIAMISNGALATLWARSELLPPSKL